METEELVKKLKMYQATAIFSVLFALIGFSYNVWRMEISEENSNIRMAAFEISKELSSLEQLVYVAHYDNNLIEGSPRKGWIKVGLVNELSVVAGKSVEASADKLKSVWGEHWQTMPEQEESVEQIVKAIDATRFEIRAVLQSLQ